MMRDYLTKTVNFEAFWQICSVFHQQLAEIARRNANDRISRLSKTSRTIGQESSRISAKEQPSMGSSSVIISRHSSEPINQQVKRDSPRLVTPAKVTFQPIYFINKCYICGNKGHYAPQCPSKPTVGTTQPLKEPSNLDAFLRDESEQDEA
jgi:hypothetical protein